MKVWDGQPREGYLASHSLLIFRVGLPNEIEVFFIKASLFFVSLFSSTLLSLLLPSFALFRLIGIVNNEAFPNLFATTSRSAWMFKAVVAWRIIPLSLPPHHRRLRLPHSSHQDGH